MNVLNRWEKCEEMLVVVVVVMVMVMVVVVVVTLVIGIMTEVHGAS
jgi:hypothetical protein